MSFRLKILLLEDSPTDAELIHRTLQKSTFIFDFLHAPGKQSFIKALNEFAPDIVLSDNALPGFSAAEALAILRERSADIPFILITGTVSEEFAVNIIKQGADDYLLKDRMTRLPAAIKSALAQRRALKEINDYRYALDQSAIVTITDHRGTIVYVNDNFCSISGYIKEELLGKDYTIVNAGYHPAMYMKDLWATISRGQVWRGEFCNRAKNGNFYWIESNIIPFTHGKGKPYQHLSISIDITERKKAEEKLLESEKRLKQAQQIAHLGNWEIDFTTNTSRWSDEVYNIFGIPPGDHNISIPEWLLFIHPDDRENVQQKLQHAEATLSDLTLHYRIIRKDGAIRYISSTGKYEFDNEGKTIGLYGIAHDITDSKKAEEEIRKSNERFKYVTEASSDIIWELNFETKEYHVFEGREKIFDSDENLDWKLGIEGKYVHEDDRERIRKSFREARMDASRKLWHDEYRIYASDHKVLHIINHAIFVRNKKGVAVRAIGAITDITEQKTLEKELLEQQKNEQVKIISTALEAQERERNSIGQELHDNVNQIIVGTKLMLSLAKEHPAKSVDIINSSIENLQRAVDENRKIAHLLVAPDLESTHLSDQLLELVNAMLVTAGIHARMHTKQFDEDKLSHEQKLAVYRIAQEQCTNIVKYANATNVNFTLRTTTGFFTMTIADNGRGMDASKKIKGIGLRNINARLSIFNGSANVITSPGKGFILEIGFPLGNR